MKKIIKKIGIIILLPVIYFLGAGEVIWYPNVTPRFITNIIVGIGIAWLLYEKEIQLIIYDTGSWIYKTNKNQKINDLNQVSEALMKLFSKYKLFIVSKSIILITTLVSVIKKSGILETVKLSFLLIGLGILIPIVYYIEYQDKKPNKNAVSFG